ncbi:MAG TPA: serine/threonine protein kinase [Azospirillum sp.]|nr:serine/threonine protein kinase [Azospirillum sp.]
MPSDAQTAAHAMSGDAVKLAERYEILPGTALPGLNSVGGNAYAARPLRDKRTEAFAIICSGGVLPRSDVASTFANVDSPAIMKLLDWGVVDWPPDRARRFCLVFEKPAGRRLMNSLAEPIEPIPEEQLTRQVVQMVVGALRELSGRGVTHGAIRPTNLFYRELASGTLMLGEGVSAPSGFGQPALLETIERGMAIPAGRGNGTIGDDLYSLGVTLLILLLGRNPVTGLDDEALVQAKIERGSYPALVGQMRLPLGIGEVIRGLLVDDPKQRWTLNDLDLWLSGRRLSPKQPQIPKRGARPMEFQGQDYWYCRTLARAFTRTPAAATTVIESGELDKWLRRSMGDDIRADAVANAIQTASSGKGGSAADRLVARVCMALDPPAPIRYRGKAMLPDGFGPVLAEAFLRGEPLQPVADVIVNQLPMFWVNVQTEFRPEFVPLVHAFDQLRTFLDRTAPGLGLERVLYEANPTMPCISPLVQDQYPMTPPDVLRALDLKASGGERGKEPIDRHIAAFLTARHKRTEEMLYSQLSASVDPIRRVIAMLTILADVQVRTATEPLPHLSAWMVSLLDPAFRRFHSRQQQEEVRRQAEAAAHNGRLGELLKIVDDPNALRRDKSEFEAAQLAYREADTEIEKLRRLLADRDSIIEGTGRQVAAIASSLISTLLVAGIIVFFAL